ncbi:MAG: nucleoside monophosphate kinase [bacterium]|nr:nucleoside monophosphate kinase [bacterium]
MTPSSKTLEASSLRAVILFGPPGSGKGTQASLLSERLNYYYMETSKLLEERFQKAKEGEYVEADSTKYYLAKEKELWGSGVLNSPPFVTVVVKEAIRQIHSLKKNLLLAGSPRTLYEAKAVMPLLKRLYGKENIKIVLIELEEEETVRRNSQRRICELMRHPILSLPETEHLTHCPLDGSKLMRRKGLDDVKNIRTRLQQYAERTLPMLEYFQGEGFFVQKVDGDRPVAEVFASIMEVVKP